MDDQTRRIKGEIVYQKIQDGGLAVSNIMEYYKAVQLAMLGQ